MRYNVLYVDDNELSTILFKESLEEHYNIFTANSGLEGISILNKENIDIIFSDEMMPEMSGTEFLHYTSLHFPSVIRVLVSGFVNVESFKDAINKARVVYYIQKPWDDVELIRVVESSMKLRLLSKENELKQRSLTASSLDILKAESVIKASLKIVESSLKKEVDEDVASLFLAIRQKLRSYDQNKDSWNLFKLRYTEVHLNFFLNLKKNHPQLSETELKYCAYVNMGMTNSQISDALNITEGAVKKGLYRVKQKIELDKELDLRNYLSKV
jgi:response regulator RpfG family c-di-GMP phosphodiesterase/DNA-binding CsgD family transcriptional regulator